MLFCSRTHTHTQVHRTVGWRWRENGTRKRTKSKTVTTTTVTTPKITVITIVGEFSSSLWAPKQFHLTVSCLLSLCVLLFRTHYFTFGAIVSLCFFSAALFEVVCRPRCGHLKIEWQMWKSCNVPFLCFRSLQAPNGIWSLFLFPFFSLSLIFDLSLAQSYTTLFPTNLANKWNKSVRILYDHWALCH